MKLHVLPKLLLRTPKFSIDDELKSVWPKLKEAISVSSKSFYNIIKDVEEHDLDFLNDKLKFTIWKYFNRAKFRATPYGTFAAYSTASFVNDNYHNQPIVVEDELHAHELVDWPIKNEISINFKEHVNSDTIIQSNSTWYIIGDFIRYVACANGQFELSEIAYNSYVEQILNTCKLSISFKNLKANLNLNDSELEEFYNLLHDMHALQLLLIDSDPNIIGEDYFKRLNYQIEAGTPKYVIAERSVENGLLSAKFNSELIELANVLHNLSIPDENTSLKKFKSKFSTKFEQNEVALLKVLDPEIGIGYNDLEQSATEGEFISEFINRTAPKSENILKNALVDHFYLHNTGIKDTIRLDQLKFPTTNKLNQALPNTMSVMFSIADDLLVLEQIGGSTANALIGRFSIVSNEVYEHGKNIVRLEEEANPDVLFFDLGYMVENTIDNINRRASIYNYQISILNFNTSANPITFDDILASIVNDEVVLRSKFYQKRLIPRIASAYNYNRSDLSIFRLFCDVQSQNLQTTLMFSLNDMIPDHKFHPRIQYKNIVVAPAKWKLDVKEFKKINNNGYNYNDTLNYLKCIGVSDVFRAGVSDQMLVFNLSNDFDLLALNQYLNEQKEVWLEEYILPKNSIVKNKKGSNFIGQFIGVLSHNEQVYSSINLNSDAENNSQIRVNFTPGSEWIYFEIYCHQQRSDMVLIQLINPFLEENIDRIKKWFFIRYDENGEHIRLRVQLKNVKDNIHIISGLSALLEPSLNEGIISNIILKTYKREIERYTAENIENAEHIFSISSSIVIPILAYSMDDNFKYKSCINMILSLYHDDVFEKKYLRNLLQTISESFNKEHHLSVTDFKKLNASFLVFRRGFNEELLKPFQPNFDFYYQELKSVLLASSPHNRSNLLIDLIHMHVNRLFNKNQRAHEMVMYYFTTKELQRLKAQELK